MPAAEALSAVIGQQLILDRECTTNGMSWSIISSAPTTSNLAAFLAGFMVTAIAVMFVERSGETPRHTLGLFASGVLVLGLDSYLFSSISARRPPMTDSHLSMMDSHVDVDAGGLDVCRGVWAQAMPAYGMLAAGSVALVGGIGWMLIHYARQSGTRKPNWFLPLLGGLLTFTAATSTTALLAQVSIDYLDMTRITKESDAVPATPSWMFWVMGLVFVGSTVLAFVVVSIRTTGTLGFEFADVPVAVKDATNAGGESTGDTDDVAKGGATTGADRASPAAEMKLRLIPLAAILTALLALLGPTFAGFLVQRGIDVQSPFVIATALTLGVFLPVGISLCICYSVPGYGMTEFLRTIRRPRRRPVRPEGS